MFSSKANILDKEGIHARPASLFVKKATQFKSEIFLEHNELRVNGKSIMGLLMLALTPGSIVKIEANGPDEKEAVTNLCQLLEKKSKLK